MMIHPPADSAPPSGGRRVPAEVLSFSAPLLTLGSGALWLYLCCAFLYDETFAGIRMGALPTGFVMVAGLVATTRSARFIGSKMTNLPMALSTAVACTTSVVALLGADLTYSVYTNHRLRSDHETGSSAREADPAIWHGELFPRRYFPTDRSFFLYKPGVHVSAATYGEFYHPAMLAFPVLADSVLELKPLSYHIGPLGLRESESLADSRILALGDSFAMGYGTDEGRTWTDLLSSALGEPVYNAGVSSTGPRQQLLLLKYLLDGAHRDSMHLEHVLWMLFEGNDLENSYEDARPRSDAPERPGLLDGTILGLALSLPRAVKECSVLRKAVDAIVRSAGGGGFRPGGVVIEGLSAPYLLYHSDRWGYRLFNPLDVERATKDRDYVLTHPNRQRLEATLEEMVELSKSHGFQITVLIAPSAARMYGPSFKDFPEISTEPHFIRFVAESARAKGLDVVDLLAEMRPAAEEHLLYYRDDHHWNAKGNQVAAEVIERAFMR